MRRLAARCAAAAAPAIPAPITIRSAVSAKTRSVEPRDVAFLGHALSLFRLDLLADLLGDDDAKRGEILARDVLFRIPQIRADQRLAAVEINLVGSHQDAAARRLAVDRGRAEQLGIDGDLRPSVDAQRLANAGNPENQPDTRVL